ncbi:hypothetical protein VB774_20955 [Pseudanabaena galeata UHCC 0370]|uniref:Tn3 transposase DDE domain-containing protein n=1 Tax=Pseudanabaena galeata UHCC 0370 TaxID=3110310 RepID=A0ABU5TP76_9CYAN|nr:hypothetical protein [Pseudanabaena galeata]MEA5480106.1 hypothetical protein [Pseudanabaena galeata UHCC 0370]
MLLTLLYFVSTIWIFSYILSFLGLPILNVLRQERFPLDAEAIAALSPYWTQHVNRFGLYALDLNRCPPPIDYDAPIVQNADSLNSPTSSL